MVEIAAAYIIAAIGCALLSRHYGHGAFYGLTCGLICSPVLTLIGLVAVGRTVEREAERRIAIEAHMPNLRTIDLRTHADVTPGQRIEPRV